LVSSFRVADDIWVLLGEKSHSDSEFFCIILLHRTEYLFMDRAYHLSMSRTYLSVPADRIVAADAFVRGVPEEEEEEEEEEDDQEEGEEDDDEGEGYSE
jgi:hypothetical protein